MKKKILIVALAIVLIGALTFVYLFNKPKRTAASEKPVAELQAVDLFDQFVADETGSNAKYNNKVLQVKGRVLSVEEAVSHAHTEGNTPPKKETVIFLETSDMIGTISCTLAEGENAQVQQGQDVTIVGICNGYLTDVVLTQCALVQ